MFSFDISLYFNNDFYLEFTLGVETVASVAGQVLIDICFQVGTVIFLFNQDFFLCNEFDGNKADMRRWWELADNYESSATGILVCFQIIHAAAVFNLGSKYRGGFFRNTVFLLIYSLLFGILSFILLANPNPFGCLFHINCGTQTSLASIGYPGAWWAPLEFFSASGNNVMPTQFRWALWGICIANLLFLLAYEYVVILGPVRRRLAVSHARKNPDEKLVYRT